MELQVTDKTNSGFIPDFTNSFEEFWKNEDDEYWESYLMEDDN